MKHFGDPCIHCTIPHDQVPIGRCRGDHEKARPIAYRRRGVRQHDGVERFELLFSDGGIRDRWAHVSEHVADSNFGYGELVPPLRRL